MKLHSPLMFASLDLSRVPLMMALGLALVVFTWRLAAHARRGRGLLVSGALMLGLGYSVVLPLQDTGILNRGHEGHSHEQLTDSTAWKVSRGILMNTGWLLLGSGLALQVRAKRPSSESPTPSLP
ncbi:MAG: hypothetical protein J0M04_20090 [Verrucomicrobia bacterium]|nr:hypothetical protein [Verrucomicrobiota bacterium]